MFTIEIQSDIETIEKNAALFGESNFESRMQALEYIEFNILDRIDGLYQSKSPAGELSSLKQHAEKVKCQLEAIDENLFQRLRADIRAGGYRGGAFQALISAYVGSNPYSSRQPEESGYDNLDIFIDELLLNQPLPSPTKEREPEMIYFQQTPARIIFELIDKAQLSEKDVFYDLGSGLGQVSILANLVSGAESKGVEFEPAYCAYASACAADLNLARVEFVNADARAADFSDGTVFFMYTPFEGGILQVVLEKLRGLSRTKRIKLFTYGSCTYQVSRQSWLESADHKAAQIFRLAEFHSRD